MSNAFMFIHHICLLKQFNFERKRVKIIDQNLMNHSHVSSN